MANDDYIICKKILKPLWKEYPDTIFLIIVSSLGLVYFSYKLAIQIHNQQEISIIWVELVLMVAVIGELFYMSMSHALKQGVVVCRDGLMVNNKRSLSHLLYYFALKTKSNIPFTDINECLITTEQDNWICTFKSKVGKSYIIKSEDGYSKECLKRLITLSNELKLKGIEVIIS